MINNILFKDKNKLLFTNIQYQILYLKHARKNNIHIQGFHCLFLQIMLTTFRGMRAKKVKVYIRKEALRLFSLSTLDLYYQHYV